MKVKELIEELRKCDPEAVVCADWDPIWFVEQMEPVWDGYTVEVVFESKEKREWIYNTDKLKAVIRTYDIEIFMDYFFSKKDKNGNFIIPPFEDIMSHVKNIPRETYKQRWKAVYDELVDGYKYYNEKLI